MTEGDRRKPARTRVRREVPDEGGEFVFGVHPVRELLSGSSRRIERIYLARDVRSGLGGLLRLAREAGVPVSRVPRDVLARKVGRGQAHQGIAASVGVRAFADPDDVCRRAAEAGDLLVLVDGVEDPRNLGAMIRTCAAAGAGGVLVSGARTVGLTPTVAKTSAGALERIPVAREPKPGDRLDALKTEGFRRVGLDPRGRVRWSEAPLAGPVVFVVGGEGRGLRPGLGRKCDFCVAIPMRRGVESLNVGVALGVLLFESVRQRSSAPGCVETSENRC